MAGTHTNIEDRKRAERELLQYRNHLEQLIEKRTIELSAANKELESFSYSVSHDLRTPLRAMDGFSKALLEDYANVLDEHGKGYLERICNASQNMGQLIDDLLKLSRVTRTEMRRDTVDLAELAHAIAENLIHDDPKRNITFDIAPKIETYGDAHLLKLLLENLLGNAWKFTGNNTNAKVEFNFASDERGTVYYVRDNGAGFDMAYADKLFGPFQRLHSVTEFEGTGIGLATAQRIVHRHGGEIWAESEVGKGATFYFRL